MGRALTPSQLGHTGESIFTLLCDRAGLTRNKSDRDETGWDFIVEFPMTEPGPNLTLDHRSPAACHIQLKSTAAGGTGRVSLRLSALERLAKDAKPALILVFQCHPHGEPIAGYAIHLLGQELARVLKQLRAAHANKRWEINRAWITFDYRKSGRRFEVTPVGLRDALTDACGTDPARYVIDKQRELAELGFEDGRFETEALLWIEGPQHLNNVLLGLEPIRPQRLQVYETRFGIRIAYDDPQIARIQELLIHPPSVGTCQVLIRGAALSTPAIFSAEAYIGPPIPQVGGPHLLISHPDFVLTLTSERLDFKTLGNFDAERRPLSRWVELIRALGHMYMTSGPATITIQQLPLFPQFSLSTAQPLDGPHAESLPQLMEFLDGWQRLLRTAGVSSTAEFDIGEIWSARDAIFAADALLHAARTAYFEFQDLTDYGITDSEVHALYFNTARLADAAVSFAAKVTLRRQNDPVWQYRSVGVEIVDVRPSVQSLDEYAAEQAETHNVRMSIDPSRITHMPIPGIPDSDGSPLPEGAS